MLRVPEALRPPAGIPSWSDRVEQERAAMNLRTDFTSQDYLRNPAAELERLRAAGPVVQTTFPLVGKVWITTTQEMAARVLKDSETFALRRDDGRIAGLRWWMPGVVRTVAENMLTMDEPGHTRLRGIVDEAFRRRAILDMEPRILALADELAGQLFAEGHPADLVERYARKLPLSVICELLGLPPADRPKFIAWTSRLTRLTGLIGFLGLIPALAAMKRYLERRLDKVRAEGGSPNWSASKRKAGTSALAKWWRWCSCCSEQGPRPRRT
jgi:cytochrome P450